MEIIQGERYWRGIPEHKFRPCIFCTFLVTFLTKKAFEPLVLETGEVIIKPYNYTYPLHLFADRDAPCREIRAWIRKNTRPDFRQSGDPLKPRKRPHKPRKDSGKQLDLF